MRIQDIQRWKGNSQLAIEVLYRYEGNEAIFQNRTFGSLQERESPSRNRRERWGALFRPAATTSDAVFWRVSLVYDLHEFQHEVSDSKDDFVCTQCLSPLPTNIHQTNLAPWRGLSSVGWRGKRCDECLWGHRAYSGCEWTNGGIFGRILLRGKQPGR